MKEKSNVELLEIVERGLPWIIEERFMSDQDKAVREALAELKARMNVTPSDDPR